MLHGLKVLELGQLIAGPFAGKTLADFDADRIEIEPADGGDPLRTWRLLPEYDAFGAVRHAAGSALPGIAPRNAYACAGGACVLVAGNGDSIFRRLMQAIGRDDFASDPGRARNDGRVARVTEIDTAIGEWTAANTNLSVVSGTLVGGRRHRRDRRAPARTGAHRQDAGLRGLGLGRPHVQRHRQRADGVARAPTTACSGWACATAPAARPTRRWASSATCPRSTAPPAR